MKKVFSHGRSQAPHLLQPVSTGQGAILIIGIAITIGLTVFFYTNHQQHFIEADDLYDMRMVKSLWGIPLILIASVMYDWALKNNFSPKTSTFFFGLRCLGGCWFVLGMLCAIVLSS